MTVQSTTNKTIGLGNGVTTVWPFTFDLKDEGHLNVFITGPDGNTTGPISPGLYEVDMSAKSTTYPLTGSPLATGYKITQIRTIPYTQLVDLNIQGPWSSETVEKVFDLLVMMAQQQEEKLSRTLLTDVTGGAVGFELPPPVPGKAIGWNDDGDGFINYDSPHLEAQAAAEAAEQAEQAAEIAGTSASTSESYATQANGSAMLATNKAASALTAANESLVAKNAAETAANAANLAAQSAADIAFTTKALMDADLTYAANTLALVTNDSTSSNNGLYIKLMASGSGSWQKSSYIPPLVDGSVTAPKIVDNAVTTDKILDGSVTLNKLSIKTPLNKVIKNLFEVVWVVGATFYNTNGDLQSVASPHGVATPNYIDVLGGTTYTLSWVKQIGVTLTSVVASAWYYDADKTFIPPFEAYTVAYAAGTATFTAPANAKYVRFQLYYSTSAAADLLPTFTQLEVGAAKTSYIPPYAPYLTDVSPLWGKLISVIGDSVCYGAGYPGGYARLIAQRHNMTYENFGVSGQTIAAGAYGAICNRITSMSTNADYALLEGGINDHYRNVPLGVLDTNLNITTDVNLDTSTFYGALEYMCRQALRRFVGKRIGFILIHKPYAADQTNSLGLTADDYFQAIKIVCRKYSIPFCNLWEESNLRTFLTEYRIYTDSNDTIHPTKDGYNIFYVPKIEAWLKTL